MLYLKAFVLYLVDNHMKLSVILPCFNEAPVVAIQLEALAKQQWDEPWEVLFCDNGSTDNSRAVAEQYQDKLPNFRIIDASAKRGSAHARNCGAVAAQGEAFTFCDADDEVAPGWVAAMGNALAHYDFVAGKMEYIKLNEPWVTQAFGRPQQDGLMEGDAMPHASGGNLGIKQSLHVAVGGFDESMRNLQDTDYCWRVQLTGAKLHWVPEAVVHYRFRNTLGGIYRQVRGYAEHNVLLSKKHQTLEKNSLSALIAGGRRWGGSLKRLLRVRDKTSLASWLGSYAACVGRLQGSIKHRVISP